MPKFLVRFIALFLVPCLVADPATAALTNPLSPCGRGRGRSGLEVRGQIFASQALAPIPIAEQNTATGKASVRATKEMGTVTVLTTWPAPADPARPGIKPGSLFGEGWGAALLAAPAVEEVGRYLLYHGVVHLPFMLGWVLYAGVTLIYVWLHYQIYQGVVREHFLQARISSRRISTWAVWRKTTSAALLASAVGTFVLYNDPGGHGSIIPLMIAAHFFLLNLPILLWNALTAALRMPQLAYMPASLFDNHKTPPPADPGRPTLHSWFWNLGDANGERGIMTNFIRDVLNPHAGQRGLDVLLTDAELLQYEALLNDERAAQNIFGQWRAKFRELEGTSEPEQIWQRYDGRPSLLAINELVLAYARTNLAAYPDFDAMESLVHDLQSQLADIYQQRTGRDIAFPLSAEKVEAADLAREIAWRLSGPTQYAVIVAAHKALEGYFRHHPSWDPDIRPACDAFFAPHLPASYQALGVEQLASFKDVPYPYIVEIIQMIETQHVEDDISDRRKLHEAVLNLLIRKSMDGGIAELHEAWEAAMGRDLPIELVARTIFDLFRLLQEWDSDATKKLLNTVIPRVLAAGRNRAGELAKIERLLSRNPWAQQQLPEWRSQASVIIERRKTPGTLSPSKVDDTPRQTQVDWEALKEQAAPDKVSPEVRDAEMAGFRRWMSLSFTAGSQREPFKRIGTSEDPFEWRLVSPKGEMFLIECGPKSYTVELYDPSKGEEGEVLWKFGWSAITGEFTIATRMRGGQTLPKLLELLPIPAPDGALENLRFDATPTLRTICPAFKAAIWREIVKYHFPLEGRSTNSLYGYQIDPPPAAPAAHPSLAARAA